MQADKKLQAESSKCDVVAQERIWKETVHRETTAAKNWYGPRIILASYSQLFPAGKVAGGSLQSTI